MSGRECEPLHWREKKKEKITTRSEDRETSFHMIMIIRYHLRSGFHANTLPLTFTPTHAPARPHAHTRGTSAFIASLSSICASCYNVNYLMEPDKQSALQQTQQKGLLVPTYMANAQLSTHAILLGINIALKYWIGLETLSDPIHRMFSATAVTASERWMRWNGGWWMGSCRIPFTV